VQNTGEASWGAVVQDEHGQVIFTAWSLIQNCANVKTAEAIACWEGIKHAILVTNTKLIMECDCASLVEKIGNWENDRSQIRNIISDIQHYKK
jgi:ribonuclease HI